MSGAAGENGAALGGEPNLAGDAGATTEGGASACVPPSADCDESSLTGCEANLMTNVANCGACNARCRGVCVAGECHGFETLATDFDPQPYGGIDFTPSDVFALSSTFSSQLLRWSKESGAQSLFTDGPNFDSIVSGVDRVYLLGSTDQRLWSMPFSGGNLSEDDASALTAVLLGTDLYAVDPSLVPYRRDESSRTRHDMRLPSALAKNSDVTLATDGTEIVLVASSSSDGILPTYSAFFVPSGSQDQTSPWHRFATGDGQLRGLRVAREAAYLDVVVSASDGVDDNQVMHELRELRFDGSSQLLQQVSGVLDFTIVNDRAYVSLELADHASALRIVPLADPSLSAHYETSAPMASLALSLPYFYFGDSVRHELSRLRAWLE